MTYQALRSHYERTTGRTVTRFTGWLYAQWLENRLAWTDVSTRVLARCEELPDADGPPEATYPPPMSSGVLGEDAP